MEAVKTGSRHQGGTKGIHLGAGLMDVKLNHVRIPSEAVRDVILCPTRRLKTETSKDTKGVGTDTTGVLTYYVARVRVGPGRCGSKSLCELGS